MPRSIVSRYGPGSPGTCPAARNAITASDVIEVARPNPPASQAAVRLLRRLQILERPADRRVGRPPRPAGSSAGRAAPSSGPSSPNRAMISE